MTRTLALAFTLLVSGSVLAEPPDGYTFVPFDVGARMARETNRIIFVYFGRYGCGYCDKTNREAFSSPQVRKRYTDHYVLVYVDSESGARLTLPSGERITEREIGTRYNAFVTPVFVFITPDGRTLLKRIGLQTAPDLLLYDDYVSGGHYREMDFAEFERGQK